ncbi:MAG: hypothetical protein A2083_02405 [Gemmatimonadetes bacterium GWC2_71_9]|nr:MAG: hypothetical protein A3I79_08800 [Gemmatimonadetes bacterium RIFCSPLOWO2_02_FULL_71_11]OGT95458.1 MAG: hypothetical protein A2083_02405 [Gemmatimonadetes bacterium GWC2_71_9]
MIAEDDTLAGYVTVHGRPPSFEGSDGRPYSVGVFSDDDPDVDGRYGAALLFIRWSADRQPDGHLETPYLARAPDPQAAEAALGKLTLAAIKQKLDALIAEHAR